MNQDEYKVGDLVRSSSYARSREGIFRLVERKVTYLRGVWQQENNLEWFGVRVVDANGKVLKKPSKPTACYPTELASEWIDRHVLKLEEERTVWLKAFDALSEMNAK